MYLFTLHYGDQDFRIKSARLAETPEAAVKAWGGEFIPRSGGICAASSQPDELGICGIVRFGPHLFREMDETDRNLAGMFRGDVCYIGGGIGLLAFRDQTIDLTLRRFVLAS